MTAATDILVVGGGAYGCILGLELSRGLEHRGGSGLRGGTGLRGGPGSGGRRPTVRIVEREPELLRRASFANQARVHNGYHYPRSFLTGLRSHANYPRFTADYRECIRDRFASYYAISRGQSNVSARQFAMFCDRIQAPVEPAPQHVRELFDPDMIEAVFAVEECVFDAERLRERLSTDLDAAGIAISLRTEATALRRIAGVLEVDLRRDGAIETVRARHVLNCTYSRTNELLAASGLPCIPLKHELTEMALVEVPPILDDIGVTVMCGPFFSLMPFPPRGCHTLSHVRYTPHCSWTDGAGERYRDAYARLATAAPSSLCAHMIQDARRYLPALGDCRPQGSIFEVKTVLPASEFDDSRPILVDECAGLRGLINVMGSKIDNVYDAMEPLGRMLQFP